jgi:RNA polymerase sigma factor (sigma-70 family)
MMPTGTPGSMQMMTLAEKQQAFEKAFKQHWEMLYRQAFLKIQSRETALDIVQEVFIVFWINIEKPAGAEKTLAYLFGILRNKILEYYAKDAVRVRHAMSFTSKAETNSIPVEKWLQHKELQQIVTEEINRMPGRMKEIYTLKKEANLSIHEIAAHLNLSEQTVKNQLQQGYNRLRLRLKDYPLATIFIVIGAMVAASH